ncbi:MAG: GNAT family N-acetyltransferase [Clostridiales bacterium]|nr:GNAT family N-acetyltransferase [Clostridiales bacterium]
MNKTGTRDIETARLLLRRFVIEDADAMYANWCSDPEVTRFLTWPTHIDVEVTRSVLNDWIPQYDNGDYFNWAMELKDTGELIGNISVVQVREDIGEAHMGYCMSKAHWGCDLMPEALTAVMDYLFDVVGMNRVSAVHDVNNPKSGRVMDKAGMKREGILRQAGRNNQGIIDEVWHSMIRSDRT